jgi:hypothetical protein
MPKGIGYDRKKAIANMGRILQGPQGGQLTSSGRNKNNCGNRIIEKKKKK